MELSRALQLMWGVAILLAEPARAGGDCVSVALSAIPQCAQSCFIQGAPTIGCDGLDFGCQCQKQAAMFAAIEGCVASSCPESEINTVIDGADKVCTCAVGGDAPAGTAAVSGTVVPPTATTSSTSVSAPSNIAGSPSSPSGSAGSGGGSGGGSPTTPAPTYFATASSVSAADRHAGLGLGLMLSAVGAVIVFTVL